ncbi:MAG: zinc-dependent metalloprotease [Myxococcota bacterium]
MNRFVLMALLLGGCATVPPNPPVTVSSLTGDLAAHDGLFRVFAGRGKLLALLPAPDESGASLRVIHVASLGAGLGSNPVGLDRGRTSPPLVLEFRVYDDRVMAIAENTSFIADSSDPAERSAVRESFAESVLWSGEVEARAADGGVLVDLSSLIVSDRVGVADRLASAGQGTFTLDPGRSTIETRSTMSFPDNVEAEALVTFTSKSPGPEVRSTTPVPQAITLRMHHSFVRLPDAGFETRLTDPRMATVGLPFQDYAARLDESIHRRLALRHRLQTKDGKVVEPIVFYVDRGAPEPIRAALIEGASWWTEAFEAAGFPDGYRVEVLPEDAHPLDARYNVIQWVHRETRGWSYGNPIIDPRTGEIIKGIVSLGSLRLRQDRMIFEGLLGADKTGTGGPDDPVQLALARVRQLAAHEVGHCLGFPHNMAASTLNRSSVMDYPAPWIRPTADGTLDVSKAYARGIGAWDRLAVEYLYREVPAGQDPSGFLATIARRAESKSFAFVTDAHSRPLSSAHPRGSLWDNGSDPAAMLDETMQVRRIALARFGPDNLAKGDEISRLQDVLVPIYLYHRYQLVAAAKLIGGRDWRYGVAGATPRPALRPVPATEQRRALQSILNTLTPEALDLSPSIVDALVPGNRSWFDPPPGSVSPQTLHRCSIRSRPLEPPRSLRSTRS